MTAWEQNMWLVGLVVLLINIVIGRVRMNALIGDGRFTAQEANRFCRNAALAVAVACLLFQSTTWITGLPAGCQLILPLSHRGVWPNYALTLLSGGVLLYWIWKRGGDQTLARFGPAFTRGSAPGRRTRPSRCACG